VAAGAAGVDGARPARTPDGPPGPPGRGRLGYGTPETPGDAPPRLAPEAVANVIQRFRARLDSPARGWPPPGGRTYAAQIRAQSLALRAWVAEGEPYLPFGWR
jgi:CRISP-associated protein Cas1